MGCSASGDASGANGDAKFKREKQEKEQHYFHEHYILGDKLGQGTFAQVRLATKVTSNAPDAVKIIDLRANEELSEVSKSVEQAAMHELMIWQALGKHLNLVNLIDVFWGDSLFYFVMELCSMNLVMALQKEGELNEKTLGSFVYHMAKGISHIHTVGVVHRDIKPDNFLVSASGIVKLADFGLAAKMPQTGGLQGIFGTAPYMCPEMLALRSYNEKSDVWSFAVTIYVFLFGRFPYTPEKVGSTAMKQAILCDEPKPCFRPHGRASKTKYSQAAITFIRTLLIHDPTRRPTVDQVLLMPYMLQINGSPTAKPWPKHMPSLRPMLYSAKKEGAFDVRDVSKPDSADGLLSKLQKQHHNVSLPLAVKAHVQQPTDCCRKDRTGDHTGVNPGAALGTQDIPDASIEHTSTTSTCTSDGTHFKSEDVIHKTKSNSLNHSEDSKVMCMMSV